ncbi:recombination protein RecR, partial [Candidatus Parcubacteria bacterium]
IEEFSRFPAVGHKTAERFVFFLLQQDQTALSRLAEVIKELKEKITICRLCGAVADYSPCQICSDPKRNSALLCIVANTRDMIAVENTGEFQGNYHVLGKVIDAAQGIGPEELNLKPLAHKLKNKPIKEIILALNPNFEGETTALFLFQWLKKYPQIKITRLARGLPTGIDLEYADELTLSQAIKHRREINQ